MKKKLLFLMTLALIGWSNVWAAAGDDADLYIDFYYDSDESKNTNCQFKSTDTEGIYVSKTGVNLVSDMGFKVHNSTWSEEYGWGGSNVTTVDTDVKLDKKTEISIGNGWSALSEGTYYVLFDKNTEKIRFGWKPFLVIDNVNGITAPYDTETEYNVIFNRTFDTENWQTLFLPLYFGDWDGGRIADIFGAGTQVAEYTANAGNELTFSSVTAMTANKPYLIKPANSTMSGWYGKPSAYSPTEVEYGNYEFIGTNAQKYLAVGTYYVADGNIHQVITENKTNIKATRAYFRATDSGLAREMRFVIDGVVTSIDLIEIPEEENVIGDIYNLNGQRIDKPFESLPAGVYIVNGKKLIKK